MNLSIKEYQFGNLIIHDSNQSGFYEPAEDELSVKGLNRKGLKSYDSAQDFKDIAQTLYLKSLDGVNLEYAEKAYKTMKHLEVTAQSGMCRLSVYNEVIDLYSKKLNSPKLRPAVNHMVSECLIKARTEDFPDLAQRGACELLAKQMRQYDDEAFDYFKLEKWSGSWGNDLLMDCSRNLRSKLVEN